MPDIIGQVIDNRYKIIRLIGSGGMADVYLADDIKLGRNVAVKIIIKDNFPPNEWDELTKRFGKETTALAKMTHPNIVTIFDSGKYLGAPYLVMEYLSGGSLEDRIAGPIPYLEAINILLPIARALAYAHQQGFIHRDVKPSNILFSADNTPKLADFGIVRFIQSSGNSSLTPAGFGLGTPAYMAPEQVNDSKHVSEKADIYALGILFYQLLTGFLPFSGDTPIEIAIKHIVEPRPDIRKHNSQLPSSIAKIVDHALEKDPHARYKTMDDFSDDLQSQLDSITKAESNPTIHANQSTNGLRKIPKEIIIIIIVIVIFILTAIIGAIINGNDVAGLSPTSVINSATPIKTEVIKTSAPTRTPEPSYSVITGKNVNQIIELVKYEDVGGPPQIQFTDNGKLIIAQFPNAIELFDSETLASVGLKFLDDVGSITSFALSPNSLFIAIGFDNGKVQVRKLEAWDLVFTKQVFDNTIWGLDYSTDGASIITSANNSGELKIIDSSSGSFLGSITTGQFSNDEVRYSPNKRELAAIVDASTILIINKYSEEIVGQFDFENIITDFAFSEDGKYILVRLYNEKVVVMNISDRTLILDHPITDENYNYNNSYLDLANNLIFFGNGNQIDFFEIATKKVTTVLTVPNGDIHSLDISPDHKFLVTSSWDETIRIWGIP